MQSLDPKVDFKEWLGSYEPQNPHYCYVFPENSWLEWSEEINASLTHLHVLVHGLIPSSTGPYLTGGIFGPSFNHNQVTLPCTSCYTSPDDSSCSEESCTCHFRNHRAVMCHQGTVGLLLTFLGENCPLLASFSAPHLTIKVSELALISKNLQYFEVLRVDVDIFDRDLREFFPSLEFYYALHDGLRTEFCPCCTSRPTGGLATNACAQGRTANWNRVFNPNYCLIEHGLQEDHKKYKPRLIRKVFKSVVHLTVKIRKFGFKFKQFYPMPAPRASQIIRPKLRSLKIVHSTKWTDQGFIEELIDFIEAYEFESIECEFEHLRVDLFDELFKTIQRRSNRLWNLAISVTSFRRLTNHGIAEAYLQRSRIMSFKFEQLLYFRLAVPYHFEANFIIPSLLELSLFVLKSTFSRQPLYGTMPWLRSYVGCVDINNFHELKTLLILSPIEFLTLLVHDARYTEKDDFDQIIPSSQPFDLNDFITGITDPSIFRGAIIQDVRNVQIKCSDGHRAIRLGRPLEFLYFFDVFANHQRVEYDYRGVDHFGRKLSEKISHIGFGWRMSSYGEIRFWLPKGTNKNLHDELSEMAAEVEPSDEDEASLPKYERKKSGGRARESEAGPSEGSNVMRGLCFDVRNMFKGLSDKSGKKKLQEKSSEAGAGPSSRDTSNMIVPELPWSLGRPGAYPFTICLAYCPFFNRSQGERVPPAAIVISVNRDRASGGHLMTIERQKEANVERTDRNFPAAMTYDGSRYKVPQESLKRSYPIELIDLNRILLSTSGSAVYKLVMNYPKPELFGLADPAGGMDEYLYPSGSGNY